MTHCLTHANKPVSAGERVYSVFCQSCVFQISTTEVVCAISAVCMSHSQNDENKSTVEKLSSTRIFLLKQLIDYGLRRSCHKKRNRHNYMWKESPAFSGSLWFTLTVKVFLLNTFTDPVFTFLRQVTGVRRALNRTCECTSAVQCPQHGAHSRALFILEELFGLLLQWRLIIAAEFIPL